MCVLFWIRWAATEWGWFTMNDHTGQSLVSLVFESTICLVSYTATVYVFLWHNRIVGILWRRAVSSTASRYINYSPRWWTINMKYIHRSHVMSCCYVILIYASFVLARRTSCWSFTVWLLSVHTFVCVKCINTPKSRNNRNKLATWGSGISCVLRARIAVASGGLCRA